MYLYSNRYRCHGIWIHILTTTLHDALILHVHREQTLLLPLSLKGVGIYSLDFDTSTDTLCPCKKISPLSCVYASPIHTDFLQIFFRFRSRYLDQHTNCQPDRVYKPFFCLPYGTTATGYQTLIKLSLTIQSISITAVSLPINPYRDYRETRNQFAL